jgi:nitrogen fixation NifU-like protein
VADTFSAVCFDLCGLCISAFNFLIYAALQLWHCLWDTSEVFSETVLDHFRNPRNAGEVSGATATVEVSNPVCGDVLKLSARMVEGRIVEARFLCRGCTTAIACGSFLTEQISGRTIAEARGLTAETLSQSVGGLPPATFHGAQLAVDGLKALIEKAL